MSELVTLVAVTAGAAAWVFAVLVALPALGRERFRMKMHRLRDQLDAAALRGDIPICAESAHVMMRFVTGAASPHYLSLSRALSLRIIVAVGDKDRLEQAYVASFKDSPVTDAQREYLEVLTREYRAALANHLVESSRAAVLLLPVRGLARLLARVAPVPGWLHQPSEIAEVLDESYEQSEEYQTLLSKARDSYPFWSRDLIAA